MQEVSGSSPLSSTLVAPILTKPDLIERLGFLLAAAIAASSVSIRRIFDSYSSPPSHFILAEVAPLRNRGPRPSSDSRDSINFPDWIDDPIARASTSLAEKKAISSQVRFFRLRVRQNLTLMRFDLPFSLEGQSPLAAASSGESFSSS